MHQSLHLTKRLLVLMKQGAWDEAVKLEEERFRMIRQEFAVESEQGSIEENIETLREIQALNQELESIGLEGKAQLSSQLRQLLQGRKAGKAYQQSR